MTNYDFDCGGDEETQILQGFCVRILLDLMQKQLTVRQAGIFDLLRQGATQVQIAHILGVAKTTVRNHTQRIRDRLRKKFYLNGLSMADFLNCREE